jgi:tRNA U34 5-methylaminomethyl-2-thiouridine-forming methyltransferase MnmC
MSISLAAPRALGISYDIENGLKLSKYTTLLCNTLLNSFKVRFSSLLLILEISVDDQIKCRNTIPSFSRTIYL